MLVGCRMTQLQRKATKEKGTATEPKPMTYTLSLTFSHVSCRTGHLTPLIHIAVIQTPIFHLYFKRHWISFLTAFSYQAKMSGVKHLSDKYVCKKCDNASYGLTSMLLSCQDLALRLGRNRSTFEHRCQPMSSYTRYCRNGMWLPVYCN